jgi:hypothetical protein
MSQIPPPVFNTLADEDAALLWWSWTRQNFGGEESNLYGRGGRPGELTFLMSALIGEQPDFTAHAVHVCKALSIPLALPVDANPDYATFRDRVMGATEPVDWDDARAFFAAAIVGQEGFDQAPEEVRQDVANAWAALQDRSEGLAQYTGHRHHAEFAELMLAGACEMLKALSPDQCTDRLGYVRAALADLVTSPIVVPVPLSGSNLA